MNVLYWVLGGDPDENKRGDEKLLGEENFLKVLRAGFDELIWCGFMNGRHVGGSGLLLQALEMRIYKGFITYDLM